MIGVDGLILVVKMVTPTVADDPLLFVKISSTPQEPAATLVKAAVDHDEPVLLGFSFRGEVCVSSAERAQDKNDALDQIIGRRIGADGLDALQSRRGFVEGAAPVPGYHFKVLHRLLKAQQH